MDERSLTAVAEHLRNRLQVCVEEIRFLGPQTETGRNLRDEEIAEILTELGWLPVDRLRTVFTRLLTPEGLQKYALAYGHKGPPNAVGLWAWAKPGGRYARVRSCVPTDDNDLGFYFPDSRSGLFRLTDVLEEMKTRNTMGGWVCAPMLVDGIHVGSVH